MKLARELFFILSVMSFLGCETAEQSDLKAYMDATLKNPGGAVDPLPNFKPYQAFVYSATSTRSPFEPPIKIVNNFIGGPKSDIKPDFARVKEYLEGFAIHSLSLVGSLQKGDQLWGLINDGRGGVHRVAKGNYLGKDHGRIISASATQLTVVEIVSDGLNGWIERPRTIDLKSQD